MYYSEVTIKQLILERGKPEIIVSPTQNYCVKKDKETYSVFVDNSKDCSCSRELPAILLKVSQKFNASTFSDSISILYDLYKENKPIIIHIEKEEIDKEGIRTIKKMELI